MLNRQNEWKIIRIIASILLFLIIVVTIVFWAKVFSFLTIVEQIYIIVTLFFLFLFAKSLAWYSLVINLLNTRENLEKTKKKIKWNKNEQQLLEIIEEKWSLAMIEVLLISINWITSILYDITLVFMLGLFIVSNATIFDLNIMYATVFWALTIMFMTWVFDRYANFKLMDAILNLQKENTKKSK